MYFPFDVKIIPITAIKQPFILLSVIWLTSSFLNSLCRTSVNIGLQDPNVWTTPSGMKNCTPANIKLTKTNDAWRLNKMYQLFSDLYSILRFNILHK